jgi:hypothetical protein
MYLVLFFLFLLSSVLGPVGAGVVGGSMGAGAASQKTPKNL